MLFYRHVLSGGSGILENRQHSRDENMTEKSGKKTFLKIVIAVLIVGTILGIATGRTGCSAGTSEETFRANTEIVLR